MKTTYAKMADKIANYRNFEGSSVYGVTNGDNYSVYSYATEILRVNTKTGEKLFRYYSYSSTTSKVQYIIKNCFGINVIKPNTKTVIVHGLYTDKGGKWHVVKENKGDFWDSDIHYSMEA